MAARAVITMSPEQYLAGLKQLEASTTKSASKMENSFKEYGTSINKAGIAMRYVSAEMGAGAVAFGRAFQVLAGGKIAIAVASIAAAFTALKKIWDEVTVSAAEYKAKQDAQIESNDKNIESMRKTQEEEDAMLERLQELAKRENKTNEETDEQIRLATVLSGKYGKLGVSVDDLTGDYTSLLDVMKKINELQNAERANALENQINALQESIGVSAKEGIVGGIGKQLMDGFLTLIGVGKPVLGGDLFDYYNSLSAQDKLGYAKSMLDRNNKFGAKTESNIAFWKSQQTELEKLVNLTDRLNKLRETGSETTKEQTAELEKHSEASRKAADEEEAAHQKRVAELEAEMKLQEELDKKASEAAQRRLEEEAKLKRAAEQRRTDALANLKFSFMRLTGQSEKAAISEAIYNESKAQGQTLDEATVKDITKRTKAQLALQRLQGVQTVSPELYAPRVNSLIARGGSEVPMKMPKVEEYQAKTLSSVDKIAKDMGYVRNYLKEAGLI